LKVGREEMVGRKVGDGWKEGRRWLEGREEMVGRKVGNGWKEGRRWLEGR